MRRQFYVIRMRSMITWGKHKGKIFSVIAEEDPSYILWIIDNVTITLYISRDIIAWAKEKYDIDIMLRRSNTGLPFKKEPISNKD